MNWCLSTDRSVSQSVSVCVQCLCVFVFGLYHVVVFIYAQWSRSCCLSVCLCVSKSMSIAFISHACTIMPECFKDDNKSQWKSVEKWEIWPSLSPKLLNRWLLNLAWVMKSGTPFPCAKFHYDPIRCFCSLPPPCPCTCMRIQSDSASLLVLLSAYSQDPCTDFMISTSNDTISRKDMPFEGSENKILHFDPVFSKKCIFWPIFDQT